ncbi:alpha/beta hydrolase-fold protein [Ulvibacter antarcticus]|uniref:Putative esterase n=1 Tax=Ulvibacter antarcticus TaxID=442714 RepID=A0A3L9YH03_9FLAO|nr:alpha/beta hydrolase-fold protein [Ulvibacter antarcticus]RMA58837.1 putative esterase [Ulvibacter antarcticus]
MKNRFIIFLFVLSLAGCKPTTDKAKTSVITPRVLSEAVLAEGQLHRIDSFPSKYVMPRTVDIWTPKDYSEEKEYAVLYMHDGQNLFDATTTWNNQEWMIDELASKLMSEGEIKDIIVVGIHNIPEIRHYEYFPRKAFLMLSEKDQDSIISDARKNNSDISLNSFTADDYLKFIVEEVKSYVDENFSTATERDNTVISGSSMGGLISMYAICEYPEVFGGAACISTHWPGFMPKENNPMPNAFFKYLNDNIPSPETHQFYFDFGTETLDQYYPPFENDLNTIFKEKGYSEVNYKNLKFEGADHSEASWQKRFDIPLSILFKKE